MRAAMAAYGLIHHDGTRHGRSGVARSTSTSELSSADRRRPAVLSRLVDPACRVRSRQTTSSELTIRAGRDSSEIRQTILTRRIPPGWEPFALPLLGRSL
jgi:hypothetical protein